MSKSKKILLDNRYILEFEPFDSGGMGEIFHALDQRLGRKIAVKVITKQLKDEEKYKERFEREGLILAELKHPNIANILDFGANGIKWIAMELLIGQTYETLPRPIPIKDIEACAKDVISAIEYAHNKNIVHCDLKPANLFAEAERSVVIDWGLGFAENVEEGNVLAKTLIRGPNGTPAYASPEQTIGDPGRPSDIYSFGVTLFELIAGRLPFEFENRVPMANAHANAPRPELYLIRSDCPIYLDKLIQWCMSPEAEDRPTPAQILDVLNKRHTLSPSLDVERPSIAIHNSIDMPRGLNEKLLKTFDVIEPGSDPIDFLLIDSTEVEKAPKSNYKGILVVLKRGLKAQEIIEASLFPNSAPVTRLTLVKIVEASKRCIRD